MFFHADLLEFSGKRQEHKVEKRKFGGDAEIRKPTQEPRA